MKNLFGEKGDPELQAREAVRHKKWSKALAYYEKKLQGNERDFALWNMVGDLHMNNKARAQAVEAWRRALEGYALEGLYENVLGIARKILRRTPEEEDVHLLLAEAYLGLEYHADCLASLRSYLKLARHRSESDLRSLFKKILEQPIRHIHLLEELEALYKDSAIEDIELERHLQDYVQAGRQAAPKVAKPQAEHSADWQTPEAETEETAMPNEDGLITLNGIDTFPDESAMEIIGYSKPVNRPAPAPVTPRMDVPAAEEPMDLPSGEGKDHYDLGMVYKEMTLWDAAIAEFEQARYDRSVRARATLALAECLQESRDLRGALELLESEAQNADHSPIEHLSVVHQMGIVHELLGNLSEAVQCFETVRENHPGYGDVEERLSQLQNRLNGEDIA